MLRASGSARRKIFLLKESAMMQFMAGNHVGEGAHRDFVIAGHAAPASTPFHPARETELRVALRTEVNSSNRAARLHCANGPYFT